MGVLIKNKINYTGSGDILNQPVIYSDSERCIGVWRDGKPLYQKVITLTEVNISSGHTVGFATDLSNIDKIAAIYGTIQENSSQSIYVLPWAGLASTGIYFNKADNKIYFKSTDSFSNATVYLNFQYTKTTDTAGTGPWAPTGATPIHYSLEEQVIGTWVDGKPLYQKTIEFSGTSDTNGNYYLHTSTIDPSIDNIFIDIDRSYYLFLYNSVEYLRSFTCSIEGDSRSSDKSIIMKTGVSMRPIDYGVVTLQYTKTTD